MCIRDSYHTINHASFKGLLFLAAGAVLHATHTRNMEEMGGPWPTSNPPPSKT